MKGTNGRHASAARRVEHTTSPTLLDRIGDPGDAAAWREFDAQYGELIVRYSRRAGLQHHDAEDIRQIAMLRLSKTIGGFRYDRSRGRFRDYLRRVVRNEISRYVSRPLDRDASVDAPENGRAPDDSIDEVWEDEWVQHHLRLGMHHVRMTSRRRSVDVFERLLAGHSVATVAAACGMTEPAVHKVKQRIRDRLKERVRQQILDEDADHE